MKVLKESIFTCALVFGLAFAVSAQNGDQKKPPPKNPPPVINPQPKPPPESNKPKKPGTASVAIPALVREQEA